MPYEVEFDGKEMDFSPIPAGTYPAYIHTVEEKTSAEHGAYLSVRYSLSEENEKFRGRNIFSNAFLSGPASFRSKEILVAVGLAEKGKIGKVSFNPADLQGKKVRVQVGTRVYDGTEQNEVKRVLPLDEKATATAGASAGANPRKM
jgi:ABC-type amino acid transport substrate-binding protein